MATPITPTRERTSTPTTRQRRDVRTAPPRPRGAGRPRTLRSSSGWLAWAGIAAALAAAIGLVIVGVAPEHEAARSARADQAASARLQGLADQHEAARRARADRAASARLQGLADQYQLSRPDLFVQPAGR